MWRSVCACRQALAEDHAPHSQRPSARRTLAPETEDSAPVSKRTHCCQTPEVRAGCGHSARPDPRGGPPERAVPVATGVPAVAGLDCVKNLRRRFRFSVGHPTSMTAHATANRIAQMEIPRFAAHGRIRIGVENPSDQAVVWSCHAPYNQDQTCRRDEWELFHKSH